MTVLTRRSFVVLGIAATVPARTVQAQTVATDVARAHVSATIDEVLALIVANAPRHETAAQLNRILMEKAALPQLARFSAGRKWREMTDAQHIQFVDAFSRYIARIYAGYFRAFEGTVEDLRTYVHLGDARDIGSKGIMVTSEIRPLNEIAISVNWIVSERSGKVAISDLVVEGISLAVTQREVIGSMFEKHRGDVDAVISELDGLQPIDRQ
ncbi:ABC transporter substrate-binding protein [Limibaculum sp. M0105]|uniref:ABC transporter substrate-binding protein n=1 Tax=Thermohalobaculum xanthum TaxID=2753746 RepID=A0A8J7M9X1_9RHOB|nr:ABC transporter substrate-binding protein [Thermohalobaculum xanthum]MBK0400883.1 ABC transporter substrate-binding protein [Thermohalobaculum xanthum]